MIVTYTINLMAFHINLIWFILTEFYMKIVHKLSILLYVDDNLMSPIRSNLAKSYTISSVLSLHQIFAFRKALQELVCIFSRCMPFIRNTPPTFFACMTSKFMQKRQKCKKWGVSQYDTIIHRVCTFLLFIGDCIIRRNF